LIDLRYLNELRQLEMAQLSALIPKDARVLEFGAGTGEQAAYLAAHGHDVLAIDLASSAYAQARVFPVQDYDGCHIPLPDRSIDVIFSSNVLEHVENLPQILAEFGRVLRPQGFGVHAVPTPAWRLWTFISGPPAAAKAVALLVRHLLVAPRRAQAMQDLKNVVGPLVPSGHGTSVEGISELWSFSARAWRNRFVRNRWRVLKEMPIGIFYTGNVLFGLRLTFARRQKLSKLLGSSARIYVVRPADGA
jgi:SAM-dependent methyltransferase